MFASLKVSLAALLAISIATTSSIASVRITGSPCTDEEYRNLMIQDFLPLFSQVSILYHQNGMNNIDENRELYQNWMAASEDTYSTCFNEIDEVLFPTVSEFHSLIKTANSKAKKLRSALLPPSENGLCETIWGILLCGGDRDDVGMKTGEEWVQEEDDFNDMWHNIYWKFTKNMQCSVKTRFKAKYAAFYAALAEVDELRRILEEQPKAEHPKYAFNFSVLTFKRHSLMPLLKKCHDEAKDLAEKQQ